VNENAGTGTILDVADTLGKLVAFPSWPRQARAAPRGSRSAALTSQGHLPW
jgi:hypothetical protein